MSAIEFKTKILSTCNTHIQEQINFLENLIKETQDIANTESKSSMGDKYETTRAMLHLENEKQTSQLSEVLKAKETLSHITPTEQHTIQIGSYIETSEFNYFIAVSIGKISIDQKNIFIMSSHAPLAKTLLGNKVGDVITFNGKKISIKTVL